MDTIGLLHQVGIDHAEKDTVETIHTLLQFALIFGIAWIVSFITRKWLSIIVLKIVGRTKNTWDDILFQERFFGKLSYLIPPIASYIALEHLQWEYADIIKRFIDIWLVIACLLIVSSLLNSINTIYESYPIAKNRPIKVFIQVIKIFFYSVVIITVFSILLNKSPEHLIVGLGAFAAVLMLIFKDSILGFVAGVQLLANRMIRIGDWIVMPNTNANGTVLEINLYTVKVQNWDMTISTIPTYQLVSQSFTNWRGMQESDGRRIMRYVNIDINSVHFLSLEEIEYLKTSTFLKDYIDKMMNSLEDYNKDKSTILDEQQLTNLGIFRKYLEVWLESNPNINIEMTHMVRQLQPTATGVPLEIYCFSARKIWEEYEQVQSDVFDHVLAVIPHFGLKVFQYSGNITQVASPGTT